PPEMPEPMTMASNVEAVDGGMTLLSAIEDSDPMIGAGTRGTGASIVPECTGHDNGGGMRVS
ncbi:MAG TPA: hypothetical protein VE861_05870, partial [Gemmatimonadaceae bacterium]|nr:hypothetical protein [Gemmatimonadaceae bacterium]